MSDRSYARIDQLLSRYHSMVAQQQQQQQQLHQNRSRPSHHQQQTSLVPSSISSSSSSTSNNTTTSSNSTSAAAAAAELAENSAGIRLTVDLPGVRPADLQVNIEDGVLTLQATRHTMSVDNSVCVKRQTIRRRYGLDTEVVDTTRVQATLEHGVLTIRAPKKQRHGNVVVVPVLEGQQDAIHAEIPVQKEKVSVPAAVEAAFPAAALAAAEEPVAPLVVPQTNSEEDCSSQEGSLRQDRQPPQEPPQTGGTSSESGDCLDVTDTMGSSGNPSRSLRPRRKRTRP